MRLPYHLHPPRPRRSRSRSPSRGNAAGKYGFIQAGDVDQKRPEFTLWAREHERVDVDNLTRREEEVLFGRFVELFNTATLPHLKYYDLGRYERKKAEKYARLHGIRVVSREEAERERGRGRGRGRLEEEAEEERRREKEEKVRKVRDSKHMKRGRGREVRDAKHVKHGKGREVRVRGRGRCPGLCCQ